MMTPAGKRVPDRVRDSPKITRLELRSLEQAAAVSRFARFATWLGPGLVVVDCAPRIVHVRDVYEAGGDWHREAFVEVLGFAGSGVGGYLGSLFSMGLIGGSVIVTRSPALTVAATGAAVRVTAHAADFGDRTGKQLAGWIYDRMASLPKH